MSEQKANQLGSNIDKLHMDIPRTLPVSLCCFNIARIKEEGGCDRLGEPA